MSVQIEELCAMELKGKTERKEKSVEMPALPSSFTNRSVIELSLYDSLNELSYKSIPIHSASLHRHR